MKYSNLETMNALSIRWSTAASKLEHVSFQACHSLPSISSPDPLLLLALVAYLVYHGHKRFTPPRELVNSLPHLL
jgi:hypothetical protein